MQKSVLNKQGKFGVKILWRYADMAIFVLRCFILTHPVDLRGMAGNYMAFQKKESPQTLAVSLSNLNRF